MQRYFIIARNKNTCLAKVLCLKNMLKGSGGICSTLLSKSVINKFELGKHYHYAHECGVWLQVPVCLQMQHAANPKREKKYSVHMHAAGKWSLLENWPKK